MMRFLFTKTILLAAAKKTTFCQQKISGGSRKAKEGEEDQEGRKAEWVEGPKRVDGQEGK